MGTKKLVDKEIAPVIDVMPPFNLGKVDINDLRAGLAEMGKNAPIVTIEGVSVKEIQIPTDQGHQLRALLYIPEKAKEKRPALLHFHAGGGVLGSPEMGDAKNKSLTDEIGTVILSIDYRLAPEHPAPAAVEDGYAALKWLFEHADEYDIDTSKIATFGESGGGGIAASLAIMAREKKQFSFAHQFLIYPMLDPKSALTEGANPNTGEFIWTREDNHYAWKSLLGFEPGTQEPSPYAAASSVESTAGLPPTYLVVGSLDLFVDEDMAFAQRLIASGVPTEMHVYPGGFHGFDVFAADSALSHQFEIDFRRAVKKALLD